MKLKNAQKLYKSSKTFPFTITHFLPKSQAARLVIWPKLEKTQQKKHGFYLHEGARGKLDQGSKAT